MTSTFITTEESKISFSYLRKFNLAMGILHLIQAIAMAYLGTVLDFSRDIYTFYLSFEMGSPKPIPEVAFTFSAVGLWVSAFLGMSAIAHFLIAGPLYNFYVRKLKQYMNPIRWFEYAISSSTMIVFIALLFGVWDFWTLFLIFVINALMNLFGYSQELMNDENRLKEGNISWSNYIFGWIAGISPWIVAGTYYFNVDGTPPDFVTYIFIAQAILFNTFAINMLLQYLRVGPWKDYLYGERMYQILSLVAKTILAWLVFGGIFQPE